MVASMHSLLDGFLVGLPQQQLAVQQAQQQAQQLPLEPQHHPWQPQRGMVQPAAGSINSGSAAAEGAGSAGQADDAAHAGGSSSGDGDGSVGWTSAADQQEAGAAEEWEEEEATVCSSAAACLAAQDQLQQHDQAWSLELGHAGDGAQAGKQSPPERQRVHAAVAAAAGGGYGAGFAGFGSPIRLHLSPAKLGAAERQQAGVQQQQQPPGSAARSLSLRGGLLALAASEQVTPAFGAPPGTRPPVFHTARSFLPPASCGSSGSHGSRDVFDSPVPASAGSSGRGAAATGVGGAAGLARGGVASPSRLPALPGGAGRKDLDSIVSSIKRLAAEMR